MLYRVMLFVPNPKEGGWSLARETIVGTVRAAELQSQSWLIPEFESDYGARVRRFPFVSVYKKRDGLPSKTDKVASFETPIHIVPSVGDLGWTP